MSDAIPSRVSAITDWPQRLLILGVLLLPILVLFKRVPAEGAVGVTVLIALWIAVRRRDFSWLAQTWVYAGAALSSILLALSPFSMNPVYSALSAVLAFRWPVFAAALVWLFVHQPNQLRRFEWSVVAVLAFIVADTVFQYIVGVDIFGHVRPSPDRLTGPFDHPLVGTFVDRLWFVAFAVVWFWAIRRGQSMAISIAMLMSAIGALFLFLTGERAALLTYLLGTALFFLGLLIHYPRWRLPIFGLMVFSAVIVIAIALSQPSMVQRSIDSTWFSIRHLGDTVYGLNFKASWAEFMAHPWTGVGARQFMEYCNTQLPDLKSQYAQFGFAHSCVIHPHGFYLGMLAEGGVGAFLAFVAMVLLMFARVIRDSLRQGIPMQAYFGGALLLTTFWPLQSSMEYFNGWTAAVIWTGVAWALARARVPG
jgi:hypothetical protein